MVLVSYSRRVWLISLAVSVAIFAIVYLTVIKPASDNANRLINSSLQQSSQVMNSAEKQFSSSATTAGAKAQQALNSAAQLTSCVAAAGTDTGKLAACHTKFGQ